jgi:hypothetical protein
MVAAVTVAAIGLGRANPERSTRRFTSTPSYQVIVNIVTAPHDGRPLLMDRETGRLEKLPLPPGMGIYAASVSPWEEDGGRQVVGIGCDQSEGEGSSLRTISGLVRMSLPDGEVLDRLPLSEGALPEGPPCWIPGATASVLYVGGDFGLYRVDFELGRTDDDEVMFGTHPRPLGWRSPMPGAGVQFRDVAWPDDSRLGGRVLVSLRFKEEKSGRYTDWQIWWLQLDRAGTSIVAAGRLLGPGPSDMAASSRLPNLVTLGGEPALAYLARWPGESGLQLRVAPIHFGPDPGTPNAREEESRALAEGCLPISPVASPDGRWITIVRTDGPRLTTEQIAIPGGVGPDAAGAPRLAEAKPLLGQGRG